MCFDSDSRPPIHPDLRRRHRRARPPASRPPTARDSWPMPRGRPAPTGAGMIVIPDVRGLHQYYKELALRFAEAGVDAIAIDFFARTAPARRPERQVRLHEPGVPHHARDAPGATSRRRPAISAGARAAPCARSSRWASASAARCPISRPPAGSSYAGVIGFYGWPLGLKRWPDRPKPIDAVPRYANPVQSVWGGGRRGHPAQRGGGVRRGLREARVAHDSKHIRAPRTASSTASRRSSRRPRPTRGAG